MFNVTLTNGAIKAFDSPITAFKLAQTISTSLAKSAVAVKVDDKTFDLDYLINQDCKVSIITGQSLEGLEVIRHSAAHLLAQAVVDLFPSVQVTIGPVIENGFYYDFAFERPFSLEDLQAIEAKMHQLAKENLPVTRRTLSRQEAIEHFTKTGQDYKVKIIAAIPEDESLSLYKQGEFEDLCRGPHVSSTGAIKAFKLLNLAGAYWKGDAKNEMLQRIYGTAWADKASLDNYINFLEEAEKRDHRKIGKSLNLFHFQEIAPGMVFWHPKGWTLYQILEQYIRQHLSEYHYQEIKTPQLMDKMLWEKSGHWENFREDMFVTETENRQYAVKPMSCPGHVQIYNQGLKSYRDLPLRLAEFGNCHRCEPSGALHGLMRVRNMVQDDGHIFCEEQAIQSEVVSILSLVNTIYKDFGFDKIQYRLALRPEKRVGLDSTWDKAELALKKALIEQKINWQDAPGEGAFYGPKIECSLSDSLGRIWQCGTIQVDFAMPERLEATYINAAGVKKIPVMIHRAILGSLERFIGILIEHYAGNFPLWLAPVQLIVLTISEKHNKYAQKIAKILQKKQIRVNLDLRNEKIGFKIREHTLQKIPYFIIVGDKEAENQTISLRTNKGQELGVMDMDNLIQRLENEIKAKVSL